MTIAEITSVLLYIMALVISTIGIMGLMPWTMAFKATTSILWIGVGHALAQTIFRPKGANNDGKL